MSVREYVGARYVPLFADPIDWDSTKTYEPLTVVYNAGNSYTSRQYVPTGIDISNDTYWARTGNYNAQIEQYRSEVATFDNRITNNTNNIATNKTDIATNKADIATNKTDIATNKADIATNKKEISDAKTSLQKEIDANKADITSNKTAISTINAKFPISSSNIASHVLGHNYIVLGDSFSSGINGNNNTTSVTNGGWANRFKAYFSKWCKVYNYQDSTYDVPAGNTGFASSQKYIDIIKSISAGITDKNIITDIVVLGGTNDSSYKAYVASRIKEFCEYCHETYPNAKVSIGVLGTNLPDLKVNVGWYYQQCEKYGAHYIYDTEYLLCQKNYIGTDGTHLTEDGYAYFQQYINDAIINGSVFWQFHNTGYTTNNNVTMSPKGFLDIYVSPKGWTVQLQQNYLPPIVSWNYSSTNVYSLFALTYTCPFNYTDQNIKIGSYLDYVLDKNNNPYLCRNGQIYLDNKNNNIIYASGTAIFDFVGNTTYSNNHRLVSTNNNIVVEW